ncbi:prepilin-type N-terminal cleavage/methylation domain-containing protein [Colwellia sp. D2M02]|uniref:PulJ/GspJ family protein n=1 Tax=Colwellia sp. D2M02 TaxID=2841562 RepID=UPI001C080D60|nr:prepilin-type N-terminal cleavage/methylation domain-containing protein [Colwellia sp. D2M02]MBU2891945.1 prepilin-type N-terminal cleavage/methylation domain-containing protein [Colwellia sp. D2M02]
MKNNRANQGFTLIEVLIAAIILFASIALVAELFSASSLSSKKAIRVAEYNQAVPLINRIIKSEIQSKAVDLSLSSFSGELLAFGVDFQWQAERISLLSPPLEPDSNVARAATFGLFNVTVFTQHNDVKGEYTFAVATW